MARMVDAALISPVFNFCPVLWGEALSQLAKAQPIFRPWRRFALLAADVLGYANLNPARH